MKTKARGTTEQSSKRDAASKKKETTKRAKKLSEYGKQLHEKQKVKEIYAYLYRTDKMKLLEDLGGSSTVANSKYICHNKL